MFKIVHGHVVDSLQDREFQSCSVETKLVFLMVLLCQLCCWSWFQQRTVVKVVSKAASVFVGKHASVAHGTRKTAFACCYHPNPPPQHAHTNWSTGRVINPTLLLHNTSHSYCNISSREFKAEALALRTVWVKIARHQHTCQQTSKQSPQTSLTVADWDGEQKERLYSSSSTHLCQMLHHHLLDTSFRVTLVPRGVPSQADCACQLEQTQVAKTNTSKWWNSTGAWRRGFIFTLF